MIMYKKKLFKETAEATVKQWNTNNIIVCVVDSGFISPKKDNDMENEEVSELMAHAKIQRVDQLLQLYNTVSILF